MWCNREQRQEEIDAVSSQQEVQRTAERNKMMKKKIWKEMEMLIVSGLTRSLPSVRLSIELQNRVNDRIYRWILSCRRRKLKLLNKTLFWGFDLNARVTNWKRRRIPLPRWIKFCRSNATQILKPHELHEIINHLLDNWKLCARNLRQLLFCEQQLSEIPQLWVSSIIFQARF